MKEKMQSTGRTGGVHYENSLQQARLKKHITQEQAAERFGCSTRALQRYEFGERIPDAVMAMRMARFYECEMADLFPDALLAATEESG